MAADLDIPGFEPEPFGPARAKVALRRIERLEAVNPRRMYVLVAVMTSTPFDIVQGNSSILADRLVLATPDGRRDGGRFRLDTEAETFRNINCQSWGLRHIARSLSRGSAS